MSATNVSRVSLYYIPLSTLIGQKRSPLHLENPGKPQNRRRRLSRDGTKSEQLTLGPLFPPRGIPSCRKIRRKQRIPKANVINRFHPFLIKENTQDKTSISMVTSLIIEGNVPINSGNTTSRYAKAIEYKRLIYNIVQHPRASTVQTTGDEPSPKMQNQKTRTMKFMSVCRIHQSIHIEGVLSARVGNGAPVDSSSSRGSSFLNNV